VEPYRQFVLHGTTGFLVKRDHEWLKYLSELAADDGLREEMGAKAREHARSWAIDDGWKLWEQAYEGLVS
jgi:glycosyltransferase involved in cell wall biosynthesis